MLSVRSRSHDYTVQSIEGPLSPFFQKLARDPAAFFLIDAEIARLYSKPLASVTALGPKKVFTLVATEEQKAYGPLEPVITQLIEAGIRRNSTLYVIGGGVLQDIGCFIATTLFRGIRWELVPTTLLAQCDSCIGGKSSINIGRFKNQLGSFYAPHVIHLSPEFLQTLPEDEVRSGLGEVIKIHLLGGQERYAWMKTQLAGGKPNLADLVMSSLAIKKRFIEEDEFDRGVRNLLNYGHTFGHAYESASAFAIPHGIAVTLGMLTATFFSEQLGHVAKGTFAELHAFLAPYFEPYDRNLASLDREKILSAMKTDKKNTESSAVNCILPRGLGEVMKASVSIETELRPLLGQFIGILEGRS